VSTKTPRLYRGLAWLWPLWGDPGGEYAEWCAHVVAMIEKHAKREAGFEVHDDRWRPGSVKTHIAVNPVEARPLALRVHREREDCDD